MHGLVAGSAQNDILVVISFSDMVPYYFNFAEGETDLEAFSFGIWGSFDGSTRPPVAFPIYQSLTLEYLQDVVLRRTGN